MRNDEVLEKIYSLNSNQLIPLTSILTEEDKQQEGYVIGLTLSEWEKKFPEIPTKNIFYGPWLSTTGMVYFDKEKYIWLNLPIVGTQIITGNKNEISQNLKRLIQEQEQLFREKDYIRLFADMPEALRMELICNMPQTINEPSLFFDLFKTFYPISTCFTNGFPKKLGTQLLKSKSAEQIKETKEKIKDLPKKDGKIIVYRGMADKSAIADEAMSWTPDINVAYFFAIRMGYNPKILTGYVCEENIIEYFSPEDSGGAEEELIIPPGKVEDISRLKLFDANSSQINMAFLRVNQVYQKYRTTISALYHHTNMSAHDALHTLRVLLYALIIAEMLSLKRNQQILLAEAAAYHDIGRKTDFVEPEHGVASRKIYEKKSEWNDISAFAIEYHCKSDESAKKAAEEIFENPKDALRVLWILKDADALDRIRFGLPSQGSDALDVKQLRFSVSKQIVPFAKQAINQIEL